MPATTWPRRVGPAPLGAERRRHIGGPYLPLLSKTFSSSLHLFPPFSKLWSPAVFHECRAETSIRALLLSYCQSTGTFITSTSKSAVFYIAITTTSGYGHGHHANVVNGHRETDSHSGCHDVLVRHHRCRDKVAVIREAPQAPS